MKEYLTNKELKTLGFFKIGKNCKISCNIRCYSLKGSLGDNVRIDDDVVLKGKIYLKNNVHIARGCTLSGGRNTKIYCDDFASLSNFVQIFSASDDYVEPNVPGATLDNVGRKKFSKIIHSNIIIGKMTLIGTFSLILPGAHLEDYSSVGAYSIIHKKIKSGYYFSNFNKKEIFKIRDLQKLKQKYLEVKSRRY